MLYRKSLIGTYLLILLTFALNSDLFSAVSVKGADSESSPKKSEKFPNFSTSSNEFVHILFEKVGDLEGQIIALNTDEKEQNSGNPVKATPSSIANGKALYMQHCSKCHGDDGSGNGPFSQAIPNIPNLTAADVQNKSDQQLFDAITNAQPPMPSFRNLSEEKRWDLVNFIRTFSNNRG